MTSRANLLPIISRSFSHAAGVRASSISLSEKVQKVTGRLWTRTNGSQQSETLVVDGSTEQLSLSIPDNLWLHLQKNLLTRTAPPLQSFLAQKIEVMNHIGPDKDIEYLSGSYQVCGLDILGNDDKTSGPTNNDTTRYTVLAEHLEVFEGLSDNR